MHGYNDLQMYDIMNSGIFYVKVVLIQSVSQNM